MMMGAVMLACAAERCGDGYYRAASRSSQHGYYSTMLLSFSRLQKE